MRRRARLGWRRLCSCRWLGRCCGKVKLQEPKNQNPNPDQMHSIKRLMSERFGFLALAAALVGMYLPVMMIFVYSFNASRIGTVWTGFSLDGYRQLVGQSDLWRALVVSCSIGAAASTISVAAGTAAAVGLGHWPRRLRSLARGVLALPLVTPDVITALALAMFFAAL